MVGSEVLRSLDEVLVNLHHCIIYRIDHEGQEVVGEAEEQGTLAERYARDVEERHGGQRTYEDVDPHGQDEEQHHRLGAVKLLVAQYVCRGVTQQYAQEGGDDGYGHGVDEGLDGLGLLDELDEVGHGEVAAIVHEGIHADEYQRQHHKQQQEYHIGDRPCAAARYEFDEFVHFRLTLRKFSSSLSF